MANKKKADVAKTTGTEVGPALDFEQESMAGFENADADSYAIPYLMILQKNSPQCDEDQGAFIKGAKAGMFINTVSQDLFDGDKGVLIVPVHYSRMMVEWVPRTAGGGFRGSYDPMDPIVNTARRNEDGRFMLENGNFLNDTRYHFCLLINEKEKDVEPVIIALTSTQIRKSRNWMTQMKNIRLPGSGGQKFTPPMYSHIYRVLTVPEENEKGNWKGWKIEIDHMIGQKEVSYYLAAKSFREQIMKGAAQVSPPPSEGTGDTMGEDIPF